MTFIKGAEFLSTDDLLVHQQAAWRQQRLHVTRHSAFFGIHWDGKQAPEDLRDLTELPLSTKSQLRTSQAQHPPFGTYLAAPRDLANRLHRTSGTTGRR